jgi:hypothetical protein
LCRSAQKILYGDTSAGASANTDGESGIFNLHFHSWLFTPEQSRSVKTRGCNRLHIEFGVRTANEMLPSPIWFSGSGVSSGLPLPSSTHPEPGKETTQCGKTYEIAQPFSCH